jgi:hypothetical protein
MVSIKKVQANPSIDLLSMTTSINVGDIEPPDRIVGYVHRKDIPIGVLHDKNSNTHELGEKYELLSIYRHQKTGNRATLCSRRKIEGKHNIPSFKVSFESSYTHPLKYKDVKKAVRKLREMYGAQFRPAEVHLAIDYMLHHPSDLHERICLRLKPGKKRTFDFKGTTHRYGAPSSACRLEIYSKTQQLFSVKNIKVSGSISRVEIRMKIPRLGNFVTSLEDIGDANWSWLYGPHFSFHFPNVRLIDLIGKEATQKSIWELREMMKEDYGVTPSNFFRDYLKGHRWLSKVTRKALDDYRWNPNRGNDDISR